MKTQKFSRYFSVYDVIFLTAAAVIFIFAVFFPPVHSVADQGDFEPYALYKTGLTSLCTSPVISRSVNLFCFSVADCQNNMCPDRCI